MAIVWGVPNFIIFTVDSIYHANVMTVGTRSQNSDHLLCLC